MTPSPSPPNLQVLPTMPNTASPDSLAYIPPIEMQSDQIWTLVIANLRQEKVPEYYYTKRKMPLLSWPGAMQRYNKAPQRYASSIGIVSQSYIVIDVDVSPMPQNLLELLEYLPTLNHTSKSGKGYRLIYKTETSLPKKMIKFKAGEIYCGTFVTVNDHLQGNYSDHTVAQVSSEVLLRFIPELMAKLSPPKHKRPMNYQNQYQDADKLLQEAQRILSILPADVTPLLEATYELRLQDFELNSYTHWLLVSHALADLVVGLSRDYDVVEQVKNIFLKWSQQSTSFYSDDDVEERFQRSLKETIEAEKSIVTFSTLRKLFWGYKIPVEEFPKVKFDKKGNIYVDDTDPRNYEFLTERLKISLVQDFYTGNMYIKGPKSIIKNYFAAPNSFEYLTHNDPHLSFPFQPKYRHDDNLLLRFVTLARDFGIPTANKGNPLLSGLYFKGEILTDIFYNWVAATPWDGTKRFRQLIQDSIKLDPTKIEEEDVDQCYDLIFKHCMHMAGLRAKAARSLNNTSVPEDRFLRAQGILILAGPQNTRKSTWIECLLPQEASACNSVTPSSMRDTLEMQRALAGAFILNIDEVDEVLEKIGLSDFKNVLTQERDTYRVMYTAQFKSYPRAAGFFGTTNKHTLRLDKTGNRRFWIIPVMECDATKIVESDYQQLWAEMLHYSQNCDRREWSLTGQEKNFINRIARSYSKVSQGEETLEMLFINEFYTHEEFDFTCFFENLSQLAIRELIKRDVLVALRGGKAYKIAQSKGLMMDEKFSLSSFKYVMRDFINTLTGYHNDVVWFKGKHFFKEGVFNYRPGRQKNFYYIFPFKEHIDELIKEGLIPPEVILRSSEVPEKIN
jgi:hypothetical protein